MPFPLVTLMQPTLIAKPFHRPGWVYEEKVDGWRMVVYKVRPDRQAGKPKRARPHGPLSRHRNNKGKVGSRTPADAGRVRTVVTGPFRGELA